MTPTIAQQVRTLQDLTPAQLAERYVELFGKPPHTKNKAYLQRHVAWKLQERESGGLSERARTRLDELIAKIDLPVRTAAKAPAPASPPRPRAESRMPTVGTTIVRRWRDQEIRVTVRENGVEWNGTVYSSLSAAAKAITGASWNGRLFFGLTQRRTTA